MPACLLLSNDLMLVSQVSGAAARGGGSLRTAANAEQLLAQLASSPAPLVILDLATPGLAIDQLVADVKAIQAGAGEALKLIAFAPHVHEARLAAAKQAGADRVLTRGQFHTQMDAILSAG